MLATGRLFVAVLLPHVLQDDRNIDILSVAHDVKLDGRTRPLLANLHLKLSGVANRLSVKLSDHVASLESSLISGRVGFHLSYDCSLSFLQVEELVVFRSDVADPDSH